MQKCLVLHFLGELIHFEILKDDEKLHELVAKIFFFSNLVQKRWQAIDRKIQKSAR